MAKKIEWSEKEIQWLILNYYHLGTKRCSIYLGKEPNHIKIQVSKLKKEGRLVKLPPIPVFIKGGNYNVLLKDDTMGFE